MQNPFLFSLIFIGALFKSPALQAQAVSSGEILCRPTDTSMMVRLFFNGITEYSAEYGTQPDQLTLKTPWTISQEGQPADIPFSKLMPNMRYYYRVIYKQPGSNAVVRRTTRSFHTQRAKGSSYTFVIQADPHLDVQSDTSLYRRCVQNQEADKPDFIIDLGDIIMTDKLKNAGGKITRDTIASRCRYLRSFYETPCHSSPLFMVLGNHEGEAGWTLNGNSENTAVWSTLERKKYYANPTPNGFYTGDTIQHAYIGYRENYYTFAWGDVRFIVLDPYWYTKPKPDAATGWRWTLGKTQYDWLKRTLEQKTEAYTFVICHQLVGGDPNGRGGIEFADLYEWGGKNLDGTEGFAQNRPGWPMPIKDLLREHEVDAFFHGHDHFFGKQEKDCLIYQECPQPSHPSFQNANQATEYGYIKGQILPNSGHLRIQVNPEEVKVEYVRAYLASVETPTRKNRDVSATYFIKNKSCYDTLSSSAEVIWHQDYLDELVYPNPFQQETQVSFTLPNPAAVTLQIFNNQGQAIKTLLQNQKMEAGQFSIIWDGTNDQLADVPTGTYPYSISLNGRQVASGLLVLQR